LKESKPEIWVGGDKAEDVNPSGENGSKRQKFLLKARGAQGKSSRKNNMQDLRKKTENYCRWREECRKEASRGADEKTGLTRIGDKGSGRPKE